MSKFQLVLGVLHKGSHGFFHTALGEPEKERINL